MRDYLAKRLGQAAITLLGLSLGVFLSVRATGDPAYYLLSPESTPEDYAQLAQNLGLDQPLPVQYGLFLSRAVRADFGVSIISRQPARDTLFERLPATMQLAGAAWALEIVVGLLLGIVSAVNRDTVLDRLAKFFAVLGIALPNFWMAIMLILLFGVVLRWLPTYGQGGIEHLLLPAFVLGWAGMAGMTRLVRSSMLEVLDSEYVKFARVKGLPERMVIYKHALKNAAVPALTFGGLSLAGLLNGSVVIESVFAWPGVGRLMLQGIAQRDFPVVQATVLSAGFFYVAMALIVDILYASVNPKVRA